MATGDSSICVKAQALLPPLFLPHQCKREHSKNKKIKKKRQSPWWYYFENTYTALENSLQSVDQFENRAIDSRVCKTHKHWMSWQNHCIVLEKTR